VAWAPNPTRSPSGAAGTPQTQAERPMAVPLGGTIQPVNGRQASQQEEHHENQNESESRCCDHYCGGVTTPGFIERTQQRDVEGGFLRIHIPFFFEPEDSPPWSLPVTAG
jgi:hypothetical protein